MKKMKKYYLPLALVFLSSCQKDLQILSEGSGPDFVINSGLNDVYKSIGKDLPWQNLDEFYRKAIVKYRNHPDINSLKHLAIMMFVNQTNLLNDFTDEGNRAIEFYCDELANIPFGNPRFMSIYLTRLKGIWSDKKIAKIAEKCYSSNMAFIVKNNNFDIHSEYSQELIQNIEKLKLFVEH